MWHHWQIAYLTKEIGLSAPGGPRLWDLKGLDYFWGVLHPLLMVAVFDITGSIDIVLNRLVSLVFGVAVVVLLFHIVRRYWGLHAAIGAALVAGAAPHQRHERFLRDARASRRGACPGGDLGVAEADGFWSGLAFGLATMARAEAWIFSLGMVDRRVLAQGVDAASTAGRDVRCCDVAST